MEACSFFGSIALVSSSWVVFIGTHPNGGIVPLRFAAAPCSVHVLYMFRTCAVQGAAAKRRVTIPPWEKLGILILGKCYLLIKLFLFKLVQSCVLAIKMDR